MSVSSVSGSNSISSYFSNAVTGLSSGLDVEGMIETMVSGTQTKLSSLQQKRTKIEWQQEAFRSIIDKMANFSTKYTSYTSNTNLLSNSFFNNASLVTPQGTSADKVSASGKSSSNIQLLGVKQLASAATYSVSGLGGANATGVITGGAVSLGDSVPVSTVSGSLGFKYGGYSYSIDFSDTETYDDVNALANAIQSKLGELSYTTSGGETKTVADVIGVTVDNGEIKFSDKQNAGNSVYISSATGKIKDTLNITPGTDAKSLSVGDAALTQTDSNYLSGKSLSVTLDGVTKSIETPEYDSSTTGQQFLNALQEKLDKAFGANKITIDTNKGSDTDGSFSLSMSANQAGSTLAVSGAAATAMGLPANGATSYLNTGSKLSALLGDNYQWNDSSRAAAVGTAVQTSSGGYTDSAGNRVAQGGDGNWYQVDENGKFLYDFKVNGVSVGKFNEDSALENVMTAVNSNTEAGVTMSYSKTTNQFLFTSTDTGAAGKIEFDGLAKDLFGDTSAEGTNYKAGQDAVLSMSVNGQVYDGITRSNNTFEVDGLTVTLKGTFGEYEAKTNYDNEELGYRLVNLEAAQKDPVTFQFSTDSDKIVDAVKSMVNDYNEMVSEIKSAYSTMPAYQSDGKTRYEPLTAEDEEDMTESAIEKYNEKAKQGILFMDSNLSTLYSKLLTAITPSGQNGADLRSIGISTSYSDGLTTLTLDEEKLRSALETDPDKVKNAFTKSKENGASSDGLMQSLLTPLNTYAKTTGEPKGILVNYAGSAKAYTSLLSNTLQTQLNNIDSQITTWQTKLSNQVDSYQKKFTQLETLISEMNNQSGYLSQLMGYSY